LFRAKGPVRVLEMRKRPPHDVIGYFLREARDGPVKYSTQRIHLIGKPGLAKIDGELRQQGLHRSKKDRVMMPRLRHSTNPSRILLIGRHSAMREICKQTLHREQGGFADRKVIPDILSIALVNAAGVIERRRY